MTGTNSSNDMLILRQNVEIYKFQWIFFMQRNFPGMKSSTTSLRNHQESSEIFQIPIINDLYIYYGLWNDHRCNSSFIHHLLRPMMSTSFFKKNLSVIMEVLFSVRCLQMCRGCLDVNKHRGMNAAILRQHRLFMSIKSFVQHSGWQEMVSLCSLIHLIGVCADRDQPEFLCSRSDPRFLGVHVATAGGCELIIANVRLETRYINIENPYRLSIEIFILILYRLYR